MTKITETWCPQCQTGTHHEDRIIDAKISLGKDRQIKGIWMMLKCMKCGVKHSAGFKMFRQQKNQYTSCCQVSLNKPGPTPTTTAGLHWFSSQCLSGGRSFFYFFNPTQIGTIN